MNLYSLFALKDTYFKMTKPNQAFAYYKNHKICLITGEHSNATIKEVSTALELISKSTNENANIIHLFYEYSYVVLDCFELVDDNALLAIIISYTKVVELKYVKNLKKLNLKELSSPSFVAYKSAFEKGISQIRKGNSYQFNLTYPFQYKLSLKSQSSSFEILDQWFNNLGDKKGLYAHGTYSKILDSSFLSNSPECLFQVGKIKGVQKIWTVPVKGSALHSSDSSFKLNWDKLVNSQKDQAELFMITDLMMNDLNKLSNLQARLISKKLALKVPGILHQCSLLSTSIIEDLSLEKIIDCLFPGGSITGAPKKSTVKILKKIESTPRGFYCGSTILFYKNIKAASINIRSATLSHSHKILTVNAGGGITIQSKVKSEFDEMNLKKNSFLSTF